MSANSTTNLSTHTFAHSRDTLHARFVRRKREQSAWDAEESRDLRIAESLQLWTHVGCVTLVEYLEVYCGIEPRTALERIRVSLALADLPLLEAELEAGTFQFSHVKELSRILVPDTEAEWVHHTRGMTYRDVQRAVAGHVRGDRPTDPTQPDERRRFVGFHIKPSTAARLFALLRAIEDERGDRFIDDDDRVNALCEHALVDTAAIAGSHGLVHETDGSPRTHDDSPRTHDDSPRTHDGAPRTHDGPPRTHDAPPRTHDVSCRGCANAPAQVWITTEGRAFSNGTELDDAELATLTCDATLMGHVDDPSARPQHALTAKHRCRILARDMCQCQVPGCRSRHHLDVHHIVHREHGGDDADANLVTLCAGHHRLHHAGLLDITRSPDLTFRRVNGDEPSRPRGRTGEHARHNARA